MSMSSGRRALSEDSDVRVAMEFGLWAVRRAALVFERKTKDWLCGGWVCELQGKSRRAVEGKVGV